MSEAPAQEPLDPEIAYWLEIAEARALADVFRAAREVPDNPIGAELLEIAGGTAFALTSLDVPFFNRAVGLGIERPATEIEVEAVAQFFEWLECSVAVVQVAPQALPPQLTSWLSVRGYATSRRWPKLWRTLDDLPEPDTSLRIEQIDESRADDFTEVTRAALGFPDVLTPIGAGTIGRPGWTHYIGYAGDAPATASALYVNGDIAWLGFGGTLEAFRGLGGQSAMFAHRLHHAAELGCRLAFTETSEDKPEEPNPSYRNMLRFGFRQAYLRQNWVRRVPSPG